MTTSTYARPLAKLGRHHLAHLRAIAEGVDVLVSAARYLALDGDTEREIGRVAARHAHQAIVDRVRAVARRSGDPRWRLIGLSIKSSGAGQQPTLARWAEERGLEEFPEAELIELYSEAFPPDRRATRNDRLRAKQLDLISRLAETAAEPARPTDRIDAWFPATVAGHLHAAGLLLLADLIERVRRGGRWWLRSPRINAMGPEKAARVERHLEVLLPGCTTPPAPSAVSLRGLTISAAIAQGSSPLSQQIQVDADGVIQLESPAALASREAGAVRYSTREQQLAGGVMFALSPEQLASRNLSADAEAVKAWIRARAKSEGTAKVYRRELARFMLFLAERELTFATCLTDDCQAYQAHLAYLPPTWIAKSNVPIGQPGWSPFARQLSTQSQAQAVIVISACFGWLLQAGYLARNPWKLIQRPEIGPVASKMGSRALRPKAWAAITGYLADAALVDPGAARVHFVAQFLEGTGLRSMELLDARLKDLERDQDGDLWLRNIVGKGRKLRDVVLTEQAESALVDYLAVRGLSLDARNVSEASGADLSYPLVGGIEDPLAPIAYRTLYDSVKTWFAKAIEASDLRPAEKTLALQASPHWFRHTFGTRALERGVDIHVVSRALGHADTRVTQHYSRAQDQVMAKQLKKAFPRRLPGAAAG